MRWVIALLMLIGLAACRYESTADLLSSATVYKVTAAFPAGQHLFQARDQSHMLAMNVQEAKATLAYQDQGQEPLSEEIVALLGSDRFPENVYVAMALGGKDKAGAQIYQYYPFWFNPRFIAWHKPDAVTQVHGLADLAQYLTAARQADRALKFDMVAPEDQATVLARFEAWRKKPAAPVAAPEAAADGTVHGFSVGDGVYVQGFFSDKPSVIQEIDAANRRVKVRRYEDGVSDWVGFDSIITRDESTVNDLGRGAAAVGLFVCMLSPETCTPAQK